MISPGWTSRPVSSSVSRMAPSVTVSSTSRKPPGCAQPPYPGSMPRRRRMTSPSSVSGIVVTTSRGFTYAMNPQLSQARRWRSSPSIGPKLSAAPQREQCRSVAAIQAGTPCPDSMSVERPSGPRGRNSSLMVGRRATASGNQHEDGDDDEHGQQDHGGGDPAQPEQGSAAVH